MDLKVHYTELKAKLEELVVGLEKNAFPGQPDDGNLYIVSKRVPQAGLTAGAVSLAPVRLAAQRIVEGSHELATGPQIEEYLRKAGAMQKEIRRKEVSRKQQFVVHMKPEDFAEPEKPAAKGK